ncbi:Uncharacterized membrane protein [Daejeonella rubra]|uniref:Uncharacterized membrane protein n=1 Tax=Daejeonella rubra TaxID=990371 RepID=A0A1G9X826_9SPHI|nr:DUF819 family protein [Daejeonella rubra]SDM92626.1 Uncharacterized membrane protein [Daejeonella rubra]
MIEQTALITNDAVVLGILMGILGLVFWTSESNIVFFKKLYTVIPPILLCYFLPGLLNSMGIISGTTSSLYTMASRYLLPASLVLFTLSLDLREIWKLRKKAGLMFITASISIMLGGPAAVFLVSLFAPEIVGGEGAEEVWRGLSTVAGTWIGGGANQAAMYEIFKPSPDLFSAMVALDVFISYLWMALLLFGAGKNVLINRFLKADDQSVTEIKDKIEAYQLSIMRIPKMEDIILILGIGFGVTGIAHFGADNIAPWITINAPYLSAFSLTSGFFWLVIIATTLGMVLSFTRLRNLEGAGASRIGSVLLYVLIATIGMQMNIMAIFNKPGVLIVGLVWILIHIIVIFIVAKLTKTPFFFLAVGSMANIGGPASAPVIASAFHPSLAPIGVLLAVFGYVIGTYGAYVCGLMMQAVSP